MIDNVDHPLGTLVGVSPRRNHRRRDDAAGMDERRLRPAQAVQTWTDGEWLVRTVPGDAAAKTYRCPGCDHEIAPGVPHVVAWPADGRGDLGDRRHWHTGWWRARGRRGPTGRPR
jgi:hypothetical protein